MIDAIRNDKPHNEAKRGAAASFVAAMGRMAVHTGQVVTYDEMLNCEHEFAAGADKLTMNSAAPPQAGPDGRYPAPQPGILKDREYRQARPPRLCHFCAASPPPVSRRIDGWRNVYGSW